MPKPFDSKTEKALEAPEDLYQPLRIVPLPFWLISVVVTLLIVALLAWGVLGRVYTEVNGMGIILPHPSHVFEAESVHGGLLKRVLVKTGQLVKKGEVVAYVRQQSLAAEIAETKTYIKKLQMHEEKILSEWGTYKKLSSTYQKRLRASLSQKKKDSKTHQAFLKELLAAKKALRKKGVITNASLENTQVDLYQAMQALRQVDKERAGAELTQANNQLNWMNQYNQVALQVLNHRNKLEHLQLRYQEGVTVKSPISGHVDHLLASAGMVLTPGQAVVTIVEAGKQRNLVAFIKPEMGKRVRPGMAVLVAPTTVNRSQYGAIKGHVLSVDTYPASLQAAYAILGEKDLAERLLKQGGSIIMRVNLTHTAKTLTGFKWTSKGGPPFQVSSGTLAHVEVVVQKQRPIVLVLPFLKNLAAR